MKKVMIVFGLFLASAQAFAGNIYDYQDYQVNSYYNESYSDVRSNYDVCPIAITRDLRMGSKSDEVSVLQEYLHDAGYMDVAPNGYFGSATRKAVMLFQQDKGVSRTGTVGYATRQEINDAICNGSESYSYDGSSYGLPAVSMTTQIPTTYVSNSDPFVQRVSQRNSSSYVSIPAISNESINTSYPLVTTLNDTLVSPSLVSTLNTTSLTPTPVTSIIPAVAEVNGTSIVHNPAIGYTIGITQKSGSITITSPLAKTTYREGDTVNLTWSTNNMKISGYDVLLENTVTSQSKIVATINETPAINHTNSFVLTKELLDAVCAGSCNNNQQTSFRIVVATPVKDIAGTVSTFRATVSPITINRPATFSTVAIITSSKTPVNSNEIFRLYTNIPTGNSLDPSIYGQFSFKVRAICSGSMTVSIAGTPCGVDVTIPFDALFFQQEIPVRVINSSWYKQEVTFEMVVTNLNGAVVGSSQTKVIVNPSPFSW